LVVFRFRIGDWHYKKGLSLDFVAGREGGVAIVAAPAASAGLVELGERGVACLLQNVAGGVTETKYTKINFKSKIEESW